MPRRLSALVALAALLTLLGSPAASAQPPGISQLWPADGSRDVELSADIAMRFAQPMQRASVAQALSVDPFVPIGLSWSDSGRGERLAIAPRGPLMPSTTYRFTLGSSVRDAEGRPLIDEPFTWRFTTRGPRVEFRFSTAIPVQQVAPSSGRGVPLQLLGRSLTIDATLYALDMAGFAERYAALDPGRMDEIELRGLTPAARWQHDLVSNPGRAQEIALPEGTPPGLYVLDVRQETTLDAQTLLVYGDPVMAVKRGRQGLTAWLSQIDHVAAVPGARVTLHDAAGAPLRSVVADAEGVAVFEEAADAAFVVAEAEGQWSLTGLGEPWRTMARSVAAPAPWTGHVHTDRPIYRPGQTLRYKATLRRRATEALVTPAAGTAVSVTLRDAGGARVAEHALRTDAFGSVHGQLQLGDDVALGTWGIEVQAEGEMIPGAFQVEAYRKPDFEVRIETTEPSYARSDSVQVVVRAEHYHGAPVTDAQVRLVAYRDRSAPGGAQPVLTREGRTDGDGQWTTSLTVDAIGTWELEAEVADAHRRPVAASATLPVHASAIDLAVHASRSAVEVGKPVTLTLRTAGRDGQPSAGSEVAVDFWRRSADGDELLREERVTTDGGGQAMLPLADLPPGLYRVEAETRDTRGRRATAGLELWVFDPADADQWAGALEITADRERYAPGDTALLMVKSPYRARALVTLEGTEVYDERVVTIGGLTIVELPVREVHAPDVTARVLLWRPQDLPDDRAEGHLVMAETTVRVPPEHRRLSVTVESDRESYQPGDEATFTIAVHDAEGRPAQAQVSLAVVDQAVLALHADLSGDIFTAFWPRRDASVELFDGLQPSHWDPRQAGGPAGTVTPGPSPTPSAPGGRPTSLPPSPTAATTSTAPPAPPTPTPASARPPDLREPGFGDDAMPVPRLRRAFPDTAYWNPTLETDADGQVQVTITLPDSLTSWRALARAVTVDTLAGQGSGSVRVEQPISAQPVLPRFAVQGDAFALDVLARNDLGGTLSGSCALEAPSLVILDEGARSLELPTGRAVPARWSVVASRVGVDAVRTSLSTDEGGDAVEHTLEIQPFTVPELVSRSGSTRDQVTLPIEVPSNALPHDTRVDIVLSPGITHGVLEGVDELLRFPYGCVEQTTSRMLPNAVVGRLIQRLDLHAPELQASLAEFVPVGVQKLYGFQHADGSWGFWHGGRNVYLTAYVLHALTMLEAGGFDIDGDVLARGRAWLERFLPGEPSADLRAYGAYVLAEAGRSDLAMLERLWQEREELDAFALASLAIALDVAHADSREAEALDALEERARRQGDTAYWPTQRGRRVHGRMMPSTPKSTAMALMALVRLRPDSELNAMAARWLMEHRQGAGWGSTHATVFAVVALTDYMLASGDPYADFAWTVELDGEPVAEGRSGASGDERVRPITITGDNLAPGAHRLRLAKEGPGTLYYSVVARMSLFHDGYEATVPEGLGLQVQRSYNPVAGPEEREAWQVGEVVNVRLSVTVPEEQWYVLVEDLLPAGFEPLNDQLRTDGDAGTMGPLPWRWQGYERKEIRDDRVTFFASRLSEGTHTFDYAVRAVTPGRFSARPAVAYAMYRTDVWGRSASERVAIAPEQLLQRPPLTGDVDRDCRLTAIDARLVADGWAAEGAAPGPAGDPSAARDVTGDGRVTVRDVAMARRAGSAGLRCGDQAPAAPEPAGSAALRLQAPPDLMAHRAIELQLMIDDPSDVAGFETTLRWPEGAFRLVDVAVGGRGQGGAPSTPGRPWLLVEPTMLGPSADGASLRIGAVAAADASASGDGLLATVRLRPLRAGEVTIDLAQSEVVSADGTPRTVTARGLQLAPEPWQTLTTVFLPELRAE